LLQFAFTIMHRSGRAALLLPKEYKTLKMGGLGMRLKLLGDMMDEDTEH